MKTTTSILGLPRARQAQRIRVYDKSNFSYMPGLNDWAFQIIAKKQRPIQTRVVRIIELYIITIVQGVCCRVSLRVRSTSSDAQGNKRVLFPWYTTVLWL